MSITDNIQDLINWTQQDFRGDSNEANEFWEYRPYKAIIINGKGGIIDEKYF